MILYRLPAVKLIIPGGSHHEKYKTILGTIAEPGKIDKGKRWKIGPDDLSSLS